MAPRSGTSRSPIVVSSDSDDGDVSKKPDNSGSASVLGETSYTLQLGEERAKRDALRELPVAVQNQLALLKGLEEYKRTQDKVNRMADMMLRCPICLERLKDPSLLPECGHTYCESCLEEYFGSVEDRCPCCGTNITIPPIPDYKTNDLLRIFERPGTDPVKPARRSRDETWGKWFRPALLSDNRKIGADPFVSR